MTGRKCSLSASFLLCLSLISIAINALEVSYDERALTIDGKRRILFSGSIHYPRSTPEMWPYLIRKAKEGGLDVIETYVFWNAHEPQRRQYDFSENLDLVRFIRTIQKEGLYAMIRIGPYISSEWNYGGLPVWLHNIPNMEFRTHNRAFMEEMKTFTTKIVDMMQDETLFAVQGGPIIIAQIENEYGNVMHAYGNNGTQYLKWCAQLADSFETGVPWVMSQQSNAPQFMIDSCDGYYCDQFQPNDNHKPKIWTENWTGGYKNWGTQNPHRPAEDVAYAVARFFQFGGTFQNYYMYHGGTNFKRTAGGPYVTTSYDYDAPLDEYGNLNQPKWGHLRQLHNLLKSKENILTQGSSQNTDYGNMVTATVYTYDGKSTCFIGNAHQSKDATINFRNNEYTIPAWSVSILPNCSSEAYNTAKVNTQTTIMVKKDNEDLEYALRWQWRQEPFVQMKDGQITGIIDLTAPKLLDQKVVTNDFSDYLWYITSIDIKGDDDPSWTKEFRLRVHTSGHVLHVFVNGKHVGTQHAKNGQFKFVHESKIKLTTGKNEISLLSTTVGLPNYGPFFDNIEVGVLGPVQLVAAVGDYDYDDDEIVKDLSKNQWSYKVGLHGEHEMHYSYENSLKTWYTDAVPTDRILVWYKTTFKSPIGDDPVVVDLSGLGKGHAWVNGNSIGRYWSSYLADENGCSPKCDYRGPYTSNKCLSMCAQPSQRWYHVPRSFLRDNDQNTLVLFEELGGQPYYVNFLTVTVGKVCANAYEGNTLELACNKNQVISEIKFASFGLPKGECGSFQKGNCESSEALSAIKAQCIGKDKCSIQVSERTLGPTRCRVAEDRRLAVEAVCDIQISDKARTSKFKDLKSFTQSKGEEIKDGLGRIKMATLTVPPVPPSPRDDAMQLYRAFKGFGCDTSAVINILAHRDATQRAYIQQEYRSMYSEELSKRLASELSGKLETAVLLWLHDPAGRDATIIRKSLTADNRSIEGATEVICSHTPSQLQYLKQIYHSMFGVYLEHDIQTNTSPGDHQKLLLAYISTPRHEGPEVNREIAQKDAKALYKAGEKKLGTDEKTFIHIFSERSAAHLAAVSSYYHDMYGHSLKKAVKNETSGAFEHALLTIIQCAVNPGKYFAKVLRKAMKGLGTDDSTLIRVIVTRTEVDMQYIKAAYLKKHKKTLNDEVHSETSGHYRTFLLSLLGPNH